MITVSICMIVKNEEKILARCLDSIADLAEEIVLVDTGSTDATKDIAKKYTDKIYDFQWIDDFAAARNFAFSKCNMDYIYSADADEVLDEENRQRFRHIKEAMVPEVEIVQMKYCNQLSQGTAYNFDEEYRPKLYKRLRQFIWTEPVHEMVRLDPIVYDSDIEIQHLPLENHAGRDLAVFRKQIGKGLRLSKRLHHMYAMELFISGTDEDFILAKDFFEKNIESESRSMDEVKEAACVVARAARLTSDVSTLLKMSMKDMLSEGSAEMCCELGWFYLEQKDYKEAYVWFYNAAHETASILNIQSSTQWAQEGLSQCEKHIS